MGNKKIFIAIIFVIVLIIGIAVALFFTVMQQRKTNTMMEGNNNTSTTPITENNQETNIDFEKYAGEKTGKDVKELLNIIIENNKNYGDGRTKSISVQMTYKDKPGVYTNLEETMMKLINEIEDETIFDTTLLYDESNDLERVVIFEI